MADASTSPMFYMGEFPHTLDAKHRITIPARWRSDDENAKEVLIIAPHPNKALTCLLVMSPEHFREVARTARASDKYDDEEKRDFVSEWYASGRESVIDKQGRLLLPEEYCELKNLKGEIVLVGAETRIEIWNREARHEIRQRRQPKQGEMFTKFGA